MEIVARGSVLAFNLLRVPRENRQVTKLVEQSSVGGLFVGLILFTLPAFADFTGPSSPFSTVTQLKS